MVSSIGLAACPTRKNVKILLAGLAPGSLEYRGRAVRAWLAARAQIAYLLHWSPAGRILRDRE
jgi:hypothetical protein